MAVQTDPNIFSPDALADESLFDEEEPQTRPGERPRPRPSEATGVARAERGQHGGIASRVPPPRAAKTQKARAHIRAATDPDAEALAIMSKVAEKLAVARSLARIATSVVRSFADQKMMEIVESDAANAIAQIERARRMATAAKEAAVHAASLAAARAAARTQEFVEEASSLVDSLDPEEAHDDPC